MDVNEAAKNVIISYCEYLMDIRDHHSLAEDMRELLFTLPEEMIKEIQCAEFKGRGKST
tara:strand:- start:102 stop:278 length:177 start_codon:yes stop_codon:yes gene_type:complete